MIIDIDRLFGEKVAIINDGIQEKYFRTVVANNLLDSLLDIDYSIKFSLEELYRDILHENNEMFVNLIKDLIKNGSLKDITDTDHLTMEEVKNSFLPALYGVLITDSLEDIKNLENKVSLEYVRDINVKAFDFNNDYIVFFTVEYDKDEDFWEEMVEIYVDESLSDTEYMYRILNAREFDFDYIMDQCQNTNIIYRDIEDYITSSYDYDVDKEELVELAQNIGYIDEVPDEDDEDYEEKVDEIVDDIQNNIDKFVKKYYETIFNNELSSYLADQGLFDEDLYSELKDADIPLNRKISIASFAFAVDNGLVDVNCVKKNLVRILKTHPNINIPEYFDIEWVDEFYFDNKKYILYKQYL